MTGNRYTPVLRDMWCAGEVLRFDCSVLLAGSGAVHFANGMCKLCFDDFVKATGGMSEGADPPAYNADTAPKVIQPVSDAA